MESTTVLFAVIWAVVCYRMAERRHRDPTLAVIAGLLFGIFAVVYYLIVGDKNKVKKTRKGKK